MALDPVLQALVDQIPPLPEGPADYPAIRLMADAMIPMIVGPAGPIDVSAVEDGEVPGPDGPVPIRIYRPAGMPAGVLHYIHGGGWSLGNLAIVDHTVRRLCRDLSMVVVASTYRLAPEHPFPAGFEDSFAVARWVLQHRSAITGDSVPAIIGGDSAGGNLAAAITIALRDRRDTTHQFDTQLLLYPAVDLRDAAASYESRRRDADPTLRTKSLPMCIADYAGTADRSDPRLSPLAAESLEALPPALVIVLSVDPLRDEGVAYADRLREAGNRVELVEFDNLTHGFVHFAGIVPAAAEATEFVEARLKDLLGTCRSGTAA